MAVSAPSGRFIENGAVPAAADTYRTGRLAAKVETARAELARCLACPRDCGVNRLDGDTGVCRVGRWARISSVFPHFGEEACLRGSGGSGTIFFSSCNLRCVFCQNWDISQAPAGRLCTADEIADLMLQLQDAGCHNINFVTPEHVAPQIVEAIAIAVPAGLGIPLVYNTSAYDGLRSLELMDGLIDIYMPDFKFWDPATARRLARAADYPAVARVAIAEMHHQVGDLVVDAAGIAQRGLLVRHLVMPGQEDEAKAIVEWLARSISPDTFVNIMGQYRPTFRVPASARYEDVNRRPTAREIAAVHAAAVEAGLWRFDDR
jgi:putative pyruvate formate lyase activating enzyme